MKHFNPFTQIFAALIVLVVIGSSMDSVPADAGWLTWLGLWLATAAAIAVGVNGCRELQNTVQ